MSAQNENLETLQIIERFRIRYHYDMLNILKLGENVVAITNILWFELSACNFILVENYQVPIRKVRGYLLSNWGSPGL